MKNLSLTMNTPTLMNTEINKVLPTKQDIINAFQRNKELANYFVQWFNKQNITDFKAFIASDISNQVGTFQRFAYQHDVMVVAYKGCYDIIYIGKVELPDWIADTTIGDDGLQYFHSRHNHVPNNFNQEQNFILAFVDAIPFLHKTIKY